MSSKPSIPKGTRDFGPVEMNRRNYIFDTVKQVFRLHGFQPIETPAMENLTTLLGKYGDEGDKLLFKILNSGDFTRGLDIQGFDNPTAASTMICEKGLRYDLTVPFARYIVQHRNDIVFPFRRYQIQPVWRADRPQKGRYREFYQCDVDIIGSRGLSNEAELVRIVEEVFGRLGINVLLKLNNRKILAGIAEYIGHADKLVEITVAIDKIDKIGREAVCQELSEKGITDQAISKLLPVLSLEGSAPEKLSGLRSILHDSVTGMAGIHEMEKIFGYISAQQTKIPVELDLSLARGLNYYTGAIFEVKALDFAIGSICGGGRYDDLTGIFGLPDTSGVGISFGADRIYDVMTGLELFPADTELSTRVLFINFGEKEELYAMRILTGLHEAGIPAELYPDPARIKKQLEYANRRDIPFVAMAGTDEMQKGTVTVKDMRTGSQHTVDRANLTGFLMQGSGSAHPKD